ncbi:hypothetical protein ACD578_02500 [Microvirga sp. RSM25]|uniref:hypothetical protein n=1 Tax=Microvirga sp. RSM25 TaxID=3273802 RepID=UPI00384EAF0E
MQNEKHMADILMLRLVRAGLFALTAYALLWLQSIYSGSYLIAAGALFCISMVNGAQRLAKAVVGMLFIIALLASPIELIIAKIL